MTGEEFRQARHDLGLSIKEASAIFGIRPDRIRQRVETAGEGEIHPTMVNVMRWMLDGYRPPEWPDRLRDVETMRFHDAIRDSRPA